MSLVHRSLIIGIFIFFGFLFNSSADAATFYTATNGSDSNSCTAAQSVSTPKKTISSGISCLSAGSTLFIRAGTYGETLGSVPSGSSWSSPVTISSYSGETVTLKPSAERVVHFAGNQYIVINGLILDGINVSSDTVKIDSGAHHIRIQNSEITNSPRNGLIEVDSSGGNEYIKNNVHNNGRAMLQPRNHGFYLVGPKNDIVRGNHFHDEAGYGLQLQYDGGINTVIEGNWVDSNNDGGMVVISDHRNLIVRNNIVSRNARVGFNYGRANFPASDGSANAAKIYNNTFYANSGNAIYIYPDFSYGHALGTLIRNNIFWQNSLSDNSGGGSIVSNNLTTDPKFVNAAGGDFHLQAGSPAINAGATLSEVTNDFAGSARPVGGAYDIGAYEYGGTGGGATSTPSTSPGPTPTASPTPTPTPTLGTLKGDLNKDGIVNFLDWSIMNSKWFTGDATADLNFDGIVNSLDFSIMNGNWLKSG